MSKFKTPTPPGGPRPLTSEEQTAYSGALKEGDAEGISRREEVRQFEEAEEGGSSEPWRGYADSAMQALWGAGLVAPLAPGGMPFRELTVPQRADYLWRSLTGQAGTAQRAVVRGIEGDLGKLAAAEDAYDRRLSKKLGRKTWEQLRNDPKYISDKAKYLREYGPRGRIRLYPDNVGVSTTPGTREPSSKTLSSAREAANLKAQAQAARQVGAEPGLAAESAVLGSAAMAALLSAPVIHFVAGEGRGSFADTQTLEGQVGALARFNEGPLGVDGLNDEALQRLADDPETVKKLKESRYITDDVVDEVYRRREKSVVGADYRDYLLQKYHTETDPIMKEQYQQMLEDAD